MKINVDNKTFGYHITPSFNKVCAEIYYIKSNSDIEIHCLSKSFGGVFRGAEQIDYIKAENWCKRQLLWISVANSE